MKKDGAFNSPVTVTLFVVAMCLLAWKAATYDWSAQAEARKEEQALEAVRAAHAARDAGSPEITARREARERRRKNVWEGHKVSLECKNAVRATARYDVDIPFWSFHATSYPAPDALGNGRVRMAADVKYQNAFGTWVPETVICTYTTKDRRAVISFD